MARDPFCPAPYPAWDRSEDLDLYRWRRDKDYERQRADWIREGPMGQAKDVDGNPLYRINDRGQWKRTKPMPRRVRREVLTRDGHACTKCGSAESLEVDHIVRYIDGGSHEPSNLRTLCADCHGKRGGK